MRQCAANILIGLFLLFMTKAYATSLDVPPELQKDFLCMARNLYFETRGEGGKGMIAVSNVVLNRVDHPNFPDSICGVIYEKNQFSWTRDKEKRYVPLSELDDKSKIMAYEAVVNRSVKDITNGAVFFHTIYSSFSWGYARIMKTGRIGNHLFYKYKKERNEPTKTEREITRPRT